MSAPAIGAYHWGTSAAAVAVDDDVLGEERDEAVDIAILRGGEEAAEELVAVGLRRVEPRPVRGNELARPDGVFRRHVVADFRTIRPTSSKS